MRRARWVTVLLVALVAGCADTGHRPPRRPAPGLRGASRSSGGRSRPAAGRGSSPPAAGRVFWAIRDRDGRDRPGRPGNALYAFKVLDGRVGEVAGGAGFTAAPLPAPARDGEELVAA
jgi:hypothetical protein